MGVDLVARTRLGEYWAIQCKFYCENTTVDLAEVATFLAASGRIFKDPFGGENVGFAARFWLSTNDVFNNNALIAIQNQKPPVQRLTLAHLLASAVDWDALYRGAPARGECRLLCNVRCLSEGIDVPALDAAIFLSPRNSRGDVVQSVGRIMRNFKKGESGEKRYGYIINPVAVNPRVSPEEALNDNEAFAVHYAQCG